MPRQLSPALRERAGKGRQPGSLNKTTRESRDAARLLLDDPDYRASLRRRHIAGRAPHMETLLHHYAYGKPKEIIEQAGNQKLRIVIQAPWRGREDSA